VSHGGSEGLSRLKGNRRGGQWLRAEIWCRSRGGYGVNGMTGRVLEELLPIPRSLWMRWTVPARERFMRSGDGRLEGRRV